MKSLALLMLIPSLALAQGATITIGPSQLCYSFCYSVPNSAGDEINMSPPNRYGSVYVSVNGVAYTGQLSAFDTNYSNVVLSNTTGDEITVTASWSGVRKCSSGHPGCSTVYYLVSGTIQ